MAFRDKFETKAATKALLAKLQLIDAVILNGEVNRMMGHPYPHADERNILQETVKERIAHLRALYSDDYDAHVPRFFKWRSEGGEAIEDALNIQQNIYGSTDGKYTLQEFLEQLTNLPYPEEKSKGSGLQR